MYTKVEPDLPAENVTFRLFAVQTDDITDTQKITHLGSDVCHGRRGPCRRTENVSWALPLPVDHSLSSRHPC